MRYTTFFCLLILLFSGCISNKETKSTYPRQIGDIAYDSKLDKADFQLCAGEDLVNQYYHFGEMPILGEKIELLRTFKARYQSENVKKESGLLRIRFVVNCKGETDRFRLLGMNFDYTEKKFDKSISSQLLRITKELDCWKSFKKNDIGRDYFMYLIFKIQNGQIIEILP